MSDFEVRVGGGAHRRKQQGPLSRLRAHMAQKLRAALMRTRVVVLGGLAAFILIVGTPHIGWDYECTHPMRGLGTCRAVAWCAYYGVQGRRIDIPEDGQSCQLVTVLPLDFGKLIGG